MQKNVDIYPHDTLLEDIPFEDYRAVSAINASGLKEILRSPLHFQYARANPKPDTPALRLGRLAHLALLEPLEAHKMCMAPDLNLRTNQGKQDLENWRASLPEDAIEVSRAEHDHVQGIIKATKGHKILRRLLGSGKRESCVFFEEPEHRLPAKCRYDFVANKTRIICDVKTTQNASPEQFARDAYKYDYALSAAMYLEAARLTGVANPDRFIWIALESKPPHAVALYEVGIDFLNFGHQLYTHSMALYAKCVMTNRWPGYPTEFRTLEPPGYARLPEWLQP